MVDTREQGPAVNRYSVDVGADREHHVLGHGPSWTVPVGPRESTTILGGYGGNLVFCMRLDEIIL